MCRIRVGMQSQNHFGEITYTTVRFTINEKKISIRQPICIKVPTTSGVLDK